MTAYERDFRDRPDLLDVLMKLADSTPDWAFDLLRRARAVYVVDKRFLRLHTPDGWTRWFELAVQMIARSWAV